MFKKIRKNFEKAFYWLILKSCSLIFRNCSKKGMYTFARLLGVVLYISAYKHRRVAYAGLTYAFGKEAGNGGIHRLVLKCFTAIAKSAAEMAFFIQRPKEVRRHVSLSGVEHLDAALAAGKGVVLVSAHFGNFPLMLGRLCLAGYPVSVVMRPMKDRRIESMFLPECRRLGLEPIYSIPRRECVTKALRRLRDNRIVFIPIDQNFGTGGVYVDFFNRKAATATGPVVFAQRTGAKVIPCFIVRKKDNTHTVVIEPAVDLAAHDHHPERTQEIIQEITNVIERYIRRFPYEWSWIHRRWKSRPRSVHTNKEVLHG